MRHHECKQLISLMMDNEATDKQKLLVADHLKSCPSCRAYADKLQKLSSLLRTWKDELPSPDLEQQFQNKFDNRRQTGGSSMKGKKYLEAVFAVVVLVVLVGGLQVYAKKGLQARLHDAATVASSPVQLAKTIASAVSAPVHLARMKSSTDDISAQQYEPYYAGQGIAGTVQKGLLAEGVSYGMRGVLSNDVKLSSTGFTSRGEDVIGCPLPYSQTPSEFSREGYNRIYDNKFLEVAQNPLSTFSIDVDTASYSNVRRFLNNNQMPPQDAARIEEMVNYFSYNYPQPHGDDPFSLTLEGSACPWNTEHQLVLVGVQGKKLDAQKLPASNLVFLIDTSGSMQSADKLELLKQSFRLLVQQLTANERVAIVTYAGSAGLVLDSTPGDQKDKIVNAINGLYAGGSTAGSAGIQLAYEIAKKNFISGGNNRVVLATDGDFNVGVSSDAELVRIIEEKRKEGVFLTVLGFGTGNYQDAKMEQLADKGNGNFYYIDNLNEGKKVLVSELGSTLFTIAKDVKIQIEFNPAHVKAYRLIGYENRILAKEDFNDDTKDAGELGAGHTVTALYEVVPAGSAEVVSNVDALKYQKQTVSPSEDLLTIKLRYKAPDADVSKLIEQSLKKADIFDKPVSNNFQFASAVAELGLLLRKSEHKGKSSYDHVVSAATAAKGDDAWGYRAEFIDLVKKAQLLDASSGAVGIQFKGEPTE